MTVLQDNWPEKPKLGTIEASGIKLGAQCARSMIEKPDASALGIRAVFLLEAMQVFLRFRIDEEGRLRFLKGFERGIKSQLANPDARIEVRSI